MFVLVIRMHEMVSVRLGQRGRLAYQQSVQVRQGEAFIIKQICREEQKGRQLLHRMIEAAEFEGAL